MVNFILSRLCRVFANFERHRTWTEYNLSVANKLTFFMILNTGVVPLIVNIHPDDWFAPGGLVEDIFYI